MDRTKTLAELVAENPARATTLDRLGLDYCCGGNEEVDAACARAGLDPAAVEAQLEVAAATDDVHACAGMTPNELITHLLDVHHGYLHTEFPELDALVDKVESVHGARHPELRDVRELVTLLAQDLVPHMMKEERVLFPAIERLSAGAAEFPFGSIHNPIRMMMLEHENAGALLARLREATGDYATPDDGCASYHALYERLAHLEHDTHLHVFEENHLLFPQAANLEASQSR